MSALLPLLDASGRAIVGWVMHVELSATVLLLVAIAVDTLVARHVRASLRIALYAPVSLRVLVPASWTLPARTAAGISTLLTPVPSAFVPPPRTDAAPSAIAWWALAALLGYVAIAGVLATRIVLARRRLAALTRSARADERGFAVHETVGPLVEGVFRPRIVLPARLLEQERVRSCVLAHEQAHVQRRDPWLLAFVQLATVVAWPFAAVWVAAWRVRRLIEVACDEAAVRDASEDERQVYGHTLLDLATDDAHPIAALGIGAGTLRARIVAIASARRWPRALQLVVVIATVALLTACGTARRGDDAPASSAHQGASSAAAPRVSRQELYKCAEAGLARSEDGYYSDGSVWIVVEPPPSSADPTLTALCRSAPYRDAMRKNSWAAEARNALGQIGKDMAAADANHVKQGAPRLCPTSAPTPPSIPLANAPVYGDWKNDPSWSCMNFMFSIPVMFQYRIESTDHAFSATATGHIKDPDGQLTELTVVLRGKIDDEGALWFASALEETWRTL